MRSSFFEFNVAMSGLFTARANLEVTSHNIANAAINGYSRQYAEQKAYFPIATYNGKGMVGTGSVVYGIGQMRDFYLDRKFWAERATLGEYSVKNGQLSITESIFNELSDSSLTRIFNDFFDKLQSLNENAGDFTYRTNVIQSAGTLTDMLRLQANSLQKQQRDINEEIKAMVQIMNSIGQQIASLNRQISTYELDGSRANDLRDQRARLVDELSLYINVEVREKEMNADYAAGKFPEPEDRGKSDKRYSVMINGYEFVNHYDFFALETVERKEPEQKRNPMDVPGLYDIRFASGNSFNIYHPGLKGELRGLIDIRDGNNGSTLIDYDGATVFERSVIIDGVARIERYRADGRPVGRVTVHNTNYKGIPHYLDKLNYMIRTLARAFNEGLDKDGKPMYGVIGHVYGYDLNGDRGNLLFTYYDYDNLDLNGKPSVLTKVDVPYAPPDGYRALSDDFYDRINVFNFAVNPDMFKDPSLFAASDTDLQDQSNNEVIKGLLKIKNDIHLFKEGQLSDFISGMITELGIDRKQAEKFEKNYHDVTTMIDNQRISVSGVNVNEEVVDLVKYNQMYQAAAKLVNIIDSIYDTTVNRLGNW